MISARGIQLLWASGVESRKSKGSFYLTFISRSGISDKLEQSSSSTLVLLQQVEITWLTWKNVPAWCWHATLVDSSGRSSHIWWHVWIRHLYPHNAHIRPTWTKISLCMQILPTNRCIKQVAGILISNILEKLDCRDSAGTRKIKTSFKWCQHEERKWHLW